MTQHHNTYRIAIIGSGNIGTDLLVKVLRSPLLECSLFIGRRLGSPGMAKAMSLGVRVSDQGINALLREPDCCDLVFDATSAEDHKRHWPILKSLGKTVIDLTPSKVGKMCVPAVNLDACMECDNVNMVSCGGQVSIPLAHVLGRLHHGLEYVEVVSTIASRSAGQATRINMDEYVMTTEQGLLAFSGASRRKAILNLNPADPPLIMHTTVFAKVAKPDMELLTEAVNHMVQKIKTYVPGYQLIAPPVYEDGRIALMVRVEGRGDYLQKYAGNLDIINCAALETAEAFARKRIPTPDGSPITCKN